MPLNTYIHRFNSTCSTIPQWLIALVGRFAIAAVFWKSGQTKIEGFSIDIISGTFELGIPSFASSTLYLFANEYQLPLISPWLAALLATIAEHVLPVMLLFGVGTRFAAIGLLTMTLVIQVFVYPSAYVVHATWAAVLLFLIAKGPGVVSLDHLLSQRSQS